MLSDLTKIKGVLVCLQKRSVTFLLAFNFKKP